MRAARKRTPQVSLKGVFLHAVKAVGGGSRGDADQLEAQAAGVVFQPFLQGPHALILPRGRAPQGYARDKAGNEDSGSLWRSVCPIHREAERSEGGRREEVVVVGNQVSTFRSLTRNHVPEFCVSVGDLLQYLPRYTPSREVQHSYNTSIF